MSRLEAVEAKLHIHVVEHPALVVNGKWQWHGNGKGLMRAVICRRRTRLTTDLARRGFHDLVLPKIFLFQKPLLLFKLQYYHYQQADTAGDNQPDSQGAPVIGMPGRR